MNSHTEASRMPTFEWTSSIDLGHPQIDEQHRLLLSLGKAVVESQLDSDEHQPDPAQLQALIEFAREHFAFEEGLMRTAGYPNAQWHAKYHASLLTELVSYLYKLQRGERVFRVEHLRDLIESWITIHINSEDRDLTRWLRKSQERGGSAHEAALQRLR